MYLIAFIYIVLEFTMFVSTQMLMTHKILILPRIIWQIKKMTPKHWRPKNYWNFFIMHRISKFRYELYMEFNSLVEIKDITTPFLINPKFTNDEIIVNLWGKIIHSEFRQNIQEKDNLFKDEVKKFKRDQHLKDLGL